MESPFAAAPGNFRWLSRVGLARDGELRAGRIALLLVGVTWLPMVVLVLMDGTAYGGNLVVPFLADYFPYGRYLAALPILVLIHPYINREAALAIVNLKHSGMIGPAVEPMLSERIGRCQQLWHNRFVRLALPAVALLTVVLTYKATAGLDAPGWMMRAGSAERALSAAGWWNAAIAVPLFRVVLLFALWKLLVWSWFLIQLARLPLNLQPLHADRCAGLSILERVQLGFLGIAAALSIQFGCVIADAVNYGGADLLSFRTPAIVFVVLMLLVLFAPLAAFIRPLTQACIHAEHAFHAWYNRSSLQVAADLRKISDEAISERLSSQEVSALTDAATLYEASLRTRKIPVTRRALVAALLAAIVPMCLPLLPMLPLAEIAGRLAKVVM